MCFWNPPIDQGGTYVSGFRSIWNEVEPQIVDDVLGMLKRVRVMVRFVRVRG